MSVVAGGLLDQMNEDSRQVPLPALTVAPDGQRVQVGGGDRCPAPRTSVLVQPAQRARIVVPGRWKLPILVMIPRGALPWFQLGLTDGLRALDTRGIAPGYCRRAPLVRT